MREFGHQYVSIQNHGQGTVLGKLKSLNHLTNLTQCIVSLLNLHQPIISYIQQLIFFCHCRVVCQELGFCGGFAADPKLFTYRQGAVIYDDVICTGQESNVTSCSHGDEWTSTCIYHSDDAAVFCSPRGKLYAMKYLMQADDQAYISFHIILVSEP